MANDIFSVALVDLYTGKGLGASGGVIQVCVNGTAHKATLLDPNNGFVSLANPVSISGGRATWAIATGSPGQASPVVCDIYGITGTGHFFCRTGVKPGDPTEIVVDTNDRDEVMIIPWAVADCVPGTEKDTGFQLPNGTIVVPPPFINVAVAAGQGSKTVSVGLLSSQGGGSATGFVNGASLTSAGVAKGTLNGASATMGTLLQTTQGGGSQVIPEAALVNNTTAQATAANISYTITSGATLAEGFFSIAYQLTVAPANQP